MALTVGCACHAVPELHLLWVQSVGEGVLHATHLLAEELNNQCICACEYQLLGFCIIVDCTLAACLLCTGSVQGRDALRLRYEVHPEGLPHQPAVHRSAAVRRPRQAVHPGEQMARGAGAACPERTLMHDANESCSAQDIASAH